MKDTRIRYNPAEREAVKQHAVQCVLPLEPEPARWRTWRVGSSTTSKRSSNATTEPGPFIFAVHETRIERLPIGED